MLSNLQDPDGENKPQAMPPPSPSNEVVRHQWPIEEEEEPPQPQLKKRISVKRHRSAIEIQRFAENENDEDFSDILGPEEATLDKSESDESSDKSTLMLNSKLSNRSWLGDQDDEDDPFAQL